MFLGLILFFVECQTQKIKASTEGKTKSSIDRVFSKEKKRDKEWFSYREKRNSHEMAKLVNCFLNSLSDDLDERQKKHKIIFNSYSIFWNEKRDEGQVGEDEENDERNYSPSDD